MSGETASDVTVRRAELERGVTELFVAAGAPAAHAALVAAHLLDADAAGVRTHGVAKVSVYLAAIDAGAVDPAATPVEIGGHGAQSVMDGRRAFGQVGAVSALDRAVELAAGVGLACVTVTRLGHLGRLGSYAAQLAQHGFLGLCCASLPPSQHGVAWHGSKEGRLGSNPFAFACPTATSPIVADLSTSATSWGAVERAWRMGSPIAPDLIIDASGAPTTDPGQLFGAPAGVMLPLGGGSGGHKGSALGLLAELLATTLGGERVRDTGRGNNLFLLAIDTSADTAELASDLGDYIRSALPIDAAEPVRLPGDRPMSGDDLVVDAHVWAQLCEVSAARGVTLRAADPKC